jgi:ubiquinone/menaquinone biosynthesis C-methylase UbiE
MTLPSTQQFDRVAASYVTSAVHAKGPDLAWLVDALHPEPTWRVLDLGAGTGHASLAIAPHVAQVVAVDLSEQMLAQGAKLAEARGITNIDPHVADVAALPFEPGSFQAACTRYSAHHWPRPAAALAELRRVLPPGAPFVLIDTVAPEDGALDTFMNALELLRDASHVRDVRESEWRGLLQQAGFEVTGVRTWRVDLDTIDWLERAGAETWRREACLGLLRAALPEARSTFAIAGEGAAFQWPVQMLSAVRQ